MNMRARLLLVTIMIVLAAVLETFDFTLFWIGYIVAELSPLLSDRSEMCQSSKLATIGFSIVCFVGLYLSSWPTFEPNKTIGYIWLSQWTPWHSSGKYVAARWWSGIGATLAVFSFDRLYYVRAFLCLRPIQYLGKISFSFYLMHSYIVNGIAMAMFHYAWDITGYDNEFTKVLGFFLAYLPMWAIIIWVADIFQRCVDAPCTAFGSWLVDQLFEE